MTDTFCHFRRITAVHQPVFYYPRGKYTLFYAPGYLVVTNQGEAFAASLAQPHNAPWPEVGLLLSYAQMAQTTWTAVLQRPFAPVCLTLYLHNECNLRCSYCYANPSPQVSTRLELPAVQAATKLVIANCQAQGQPFTLVCHGGGEPTLHHHLLRRLLKEVERMVEACGLSMFRYVATNGVMSSAKARWLAEQFDLIGLSCDGPEMIQVAQRPLWGGESSTPFVERTAEIIHQAGKPLHVRVTITPASAPYQSEVAAYLCQVIRPAEIHVEPVYQGGRARLQDGLTSVEWFVPEFLRAREVAGQYGVSWRISSSRPGDIHGPYCHLFRDVLNLVPGGVATACFKASSAVQAGLQDVAIGEVGNGRFMLNNAHIDHLRQTLHPLPTACQDCFNQYHCTRACPDSCALSGANPIGTFRCRMNQQLLATHLLKTAETLWAAGQPVNGIPISNL